MRNKRLHPTRFFLHRYFYLGVAMLAVFFLVLPMQALVRFWDPAERWPILPRKFAPSFPGRFFILF